MIGSVGGGGNALLALLQARTAKKSPAATAPQDTKDAEATKVQDERQQRAEDALRSLTQMNANAKGARKAAAKQKVDRLKKELEALRQFSGGDPKAIARQAARIARELGAAAKEYASAGGGVSVSAPSAGASGADASAQEAGAQGAAATAENAAATAEGEADSAEGDAENAAKAAASDAERVAEDAEAEAGEAGKDAEQADSAKPLSPEEERAAFADKLNAQISETERKSGEAQADKKFENEVRRLLNEAKAILEQQRHRAKQQNRDDSDFDQFAKDVADAGKTIDQAFSAGGIEPGLMVMAQAPVNIVI